VANLNVPEPTYDYDIARLVTAYKNAFKTVLGELNQFDLSSGSRANSVATLKEIERVLRNLDKDAAKWVDEHIPESAREGVARALVNLELAETLDDALKIAEFNRLNENMIEAAIADTQDDLLAMTNNVNKRVRSTVRQTVAEVAREQAAAGINGRRTANRATLDKLRNRLGKTVETGIIDAGNNRWRPDDYVDMVTRTKMNETYREATTNEAVSRGALYGIISSHGAKDACRFHEGRIIRLTEAGDTSYPTYAQLKSSGQIWHPRCKHHYSVFRQPSDLPTDIVDKAERQAETGEKALATKKRNPKEVT
jgi:hypothetical protein